MTIYWTDEEMEFLKENYSTHSVKELSQHLNRSLGAIYEKASQMELKRDSYHWTQEQVDKLYDVTEKTNYRSIGRRIGKSKQQVRAKLNNLGVSFSTLRSNVTVAYVCKQFDMSSYNMAHKMTKAGFEITTVKQQERKNLYTIDPEHFWEKVQEHPHMFDLKAYEKRTILPEPDNLNELIEHCEYKPFTRKDWTMKEIKLLNKYHEEGLKNTEIAKKLNRTPSSVGHKRRLLKG